MVLITEAFEELAKATLLSRGMPDLPLIVLPHDTEVMPMDRLRVEVERAIEDELLPLIESAKV